MEKQSAVVAQTLIIESWRGLECMPPNLRPFYTASIAALDLDPLRSHANKLRGRDDCVIRRDGFACGKDHVVFEVVFGDGTVWVARLPLYVQSNYEVTHASPHMSSEIDTLGFIKLHSRLPVPEVHGYNLDEDNNVGAPYMFTSVIRGRRLHNLPRVPDDIKPHVYRQVSQLILQLSQLPRWQKIGHILKLNGDYAISGLSFANEGSPSVNAASSAREYYDVRAQTFLDLMIASKDPDKITTAWLFRETIPHIVQPETYFPNGFPLCHADFSNCNFLYDDYNNLAGVLDWTGVQSGPWELLCVLPHEFASRINAAGDIQLHSRNLFISIFEQEERKFDSTTPLANFMRSKAGRMAELVESFQYVNTRPGIPRFDVYELVTLMYGEEVKWEDIKARAKAALYLLDIEF
jgi:aminoglycoside phosphotransferase (APT) family kinase protein